MNTAEYQGLAEVTKSNSFYGEYISIREMMDTLNEFVAITAKLDKLKKKLFYGRGIGLEETGQMPARNYIGGSLASINGLTGRDETIIHSLLGFATEGGENAEILRDWLAEFVLTNKVPAWDCVKLAEEVGGLYWYGAIQSNATGISMEQTMVINIEQLRQRFKGKFDAAAANKRNLDAEHAAMVLAAPKSTMVDVAAPRQFGENSRENEAAILRALGDSELELVKAAAIEQDEKRMMPRADDEIERHREQNGI